MYKFYLSTLIVLSVTLLICCTKNTDSGFKSKTFTKDEIIQHAKDWYLKKYPGTTNGRIANAESPDWTAATASVVNNIEVTIVPTYISMATGTVKEQIIMMDQMTGIGSSRVLEIIPQNVYNSTTGFTTRYKNFTGTVKVYGDNNVLRSTINYTNGLRSGTGSRELQTTLASPIIEGINLNEVEIIAPSLPSLSGFIYISFPAYSTYDAYQMPITLYPDMWGRGGGVSGAPGNYTVNDIEDHLTDPCLKAVLAKLLNGDCKTFLMQLLNDMFGASGNFTLNFYQKTAAQMPGTEFFGNLDLTNSVHNGATGATASGNYAINLNVTRLSNASQELQAAVILHEALHALFSARGITDLAQHDLMAESYRSKLAAALMEYFPTLPAADAQALAWGGLSMTYDWNMAAISANPNLTSITNTIRKYETGLNGTLCPH